MNTPSLSLKGAQEWYLGRANREKYLMVGGVVLIALSLYSLLRVPDLSIEVERLDEQRTRLAAQVDNTKIPKATGPNAATLSRELSDSSISLEEENRVLGALEANFADMSSPEELQALLLDFGLLAGRVGVTVVELRPGVLARPSDNPLAAALVVSPDFRRPLREVEVVGTFSALREFVSRLRELPHEVTVVRVAASRPRADAAEEFPIGFLRANLLVVF